MTGEDKRSVLDIPDWIGWSKFLKLYKQYEETPYPDDSRNSFLLIFEGGFRASEAIQITRDQCKWNDEAILIQNAPVLKKKTPTTRNVIIKLDEHNPLGYEFKQIIEDCKTKYLLPKRSRFYRNTIEDKPTSYRSLFNRVNEINGLFPHSLRAYRAMMLVNERGFSVQDLVKWFEWTKADMAVHYTRTRDIATRMGIKELPI